MTYTKVDIGVWKPENKGDSIEGIYTGTESDVGENKSKLYHLEVEDKPYSIWGSAVLDAKMVAVKPGDKIKIEYLGTGEAQKGRNPPKLFEVYIDYDFRNATEGAANETEPEVVKVG